ncbi:MAG: hypothetical protein IT371_30000 [Deltaproteobacteria bacterium]|nr:hypothetical protein [Deltaproteobacteria bacterium]
MLCRRPAVRVVFASLLLAACGQDVVPTAVRLTVEFDLGWKLDQLLVEGSALGAEPGPKLSHTPEPPTPLASGYKVVLLLPESWAERETTLTVTGLAAGKGVAQGLTRQTPKLGVVLEATVRLEKTACPTTCTLGLAECVGDRTRVCQKGIDGCPAWSAPHACPSQRPYCSSGSCVATCADECPTAAARRCTAGGFRVCGQHDSDPCLDWGPSTSCGTGEECRETDGACVPSCASGTCTCSGDETQPCTAVGECRDGVRRCENGQFGPCTWQVAPAPETCDGKDNDCDGKVDEAEELVPLPCEKVAGVCAGALKKCGGAAGWLPCSDADYRSVAQAAGASYEVTETACDGRDNDCNGKVDEPAACCKPDCTNKACGAPDGCNRLCQQGVCALLNSVCRSGQCGCLYASCGAACCAAGQICAGTGCCAPSCGTRVCGPDPVCGSSCGTCQPGRRCTPQGQCEKCKPSGC